MEGGSVRGCKDVWDRPPGVRLRWGNPEMGVGGVRVPWVLGGMGGFLLLTGPFVIKSKPNECLGSSLGRPLALPPQSQLVPRGSSSGPHSENSTGALAGPWGPLALPASSQNPVDASAHPWGGLGSAPAPPPPHPGWSLGGAWLSPAPPHVA